MNYVAIIIVLTALITSCTPWTQKDAMHLFVSHMNNTVMMEDNIDGWLAPTTAVKLLGIKEVKPGVLEYSFEDKRAKLFRSSNKKCRFIFIVEKKSGKIIDWRYNGNKEYCTDNP